MKNCTFYCLSLEHCRRYKIRQIFEADVYVTCIYHYGICRLEIFGERSGARMMRTKYWKFRKIGIYVEHYGMRDSVVYNYIIIIARIFGERERSNKCVICVDIVYGLSIAVLFFAKNVAGKSCAIHFKIWCRPWYTLAGCMAFISNIPISACYSKRDTVYQCKR